MPRARKPKGAPPPDDASAKPAGDAPAEDDEGAGRPSQLDQIRAAMATPAAGEEEMVELPAPEAEEAPELPAHEEAASSEVTAVEEPPADSQADETESAPAATEAAAAPVTAPWVPPPTQAPPSMASGMGAATAAPARPASGIAVGVVLVVVGVFFLVMRLFDIDLSNYGWPLYVIVPGLTLVVVGFVSLGTAAIIPGGIVTMTGLVLAYQNSTGDWASWSYAWALVVPGGVGIGLFLQGLRDRDPKLLRQGRSLMFWSLMIFLIGFVLFESILGVSGIDYGVVGRAALPVLLIIIGVTLLARSYQRGRSA